MTVKQYKEIIKDANELYTNIRTIGHNGMTTKKSYYFAKSVLNPKKDITKVSIGSAPDPRGKKTGVNIKLSKNEYMAILKHHVEFIEKKHRLPNFVDVKGTHVHPDIFCAYAGYLCKVLHDKGHLPSSQNLQSDVYKQPKQPYDEVYDYFIKVFGKFGDTIDGALSKVQDHGYSGYYDDMYSNKQSIDRMKSYKGINCTDSCHVFYAIMKKLISKGKYKKVECLHVMCSSGTGHVRLRITLNDGSQILRDPACTLSDNGSLTCNWCTSNYELLDIDPDWFMENLYR